MSDGRSGNLPESRTVLARLSYLIDMQTIRIMDLLTNTTLATINHDTRIDWLVCTYLFVCVCLCLCLYLCLCLCQCLCVLMNVCMCL